METMLHEHHIDTGVILASVDESTRNLESIFEMQEVSTSPPYQLLRKPRNARNSMVHEQLEWYQQEVTNSVLGYLKKFEFRHEL